MTNKFLSQMNFLMVKSSPLLRAALLWTAGLLFLATFIQMPIKWYDEGLILTGADRVAKGELPYLDFWTLYPPGQIFSLAGLFDMFGTNTLVARTYDLAIKSALALAAFYWMLEARISHKLALSGWFGMLLWLGYPNFALYPVYPSILLVLLSLIFLNRHLQSNKLIELFTSVFVLVWSALYRIDLGTYAGIAIASGLLLCRRSTLLPFIGCCLVFLLPLLVFLHFQFGLQVLFDNIITTPLHLIPNYRSLPYPAPGLGSKKIVYYLIPGILCVGLLISLRKTQRDDSPKRLVLLLTALTGILFLNQVRVRSDLIHLLPSGVFAIIALCLLASPAVEPIKTTRLYQKSLRVFFCLLLLSAIYKPFNNWFTSVRHFSPAECWSNSYASCLMQQQLSEDERSVLKWIDQHTSPSDSLYVGVANHDLFTTNYVSFYFLTQRRPATRYHELHPGVTTTRAVQLEMIKELESNTPPVIILSSNFKREPNLSAKDDAVDLLDMYIRAHYRNEATFGIFSVWTKLE